jgi:hypothetical protein
VELRHFTGNDEDPTTEYRMALIEAIQKADGNFLRALAESARPLYSTSTVSSHFKAA